MTNDVALFWEWLGVLSGLVVLFAIAVFRIQWQEPPEPQTWIDRILESDHVLDSDSSLPPSESSDR